MHQFRLFSFLLIALCLVKISAKPQPIYFTIAKVEGKIISNYDLDQKMALSLERLNRYFKKNSAEYKQEANRLNQSALNQLIEDALILEEFKTSGLEIPPKSLKDAVNKEIKRRNFLSKDKLHKDLIEQGISLKVYEKKIEEELLISWVKSSRLTRSSPISDKILRENYAKYRSQFRNIQEDAINFSKILIAKDASNTGNKKQALVDKVNKALKKGESFSKLAKKYSNDEYSSRGGVWPSKKRKELAPQIQEVLFTAEVGQVIGPIKNELGWSFFKVSDKKIAKPLKFEAVRHRLERQLQFQARAKDYAKWIKELKSRAKIQIFQ